MEAPVILLNGDLDFPLKSGQAQSFYVAEDVKNEDSTKAPFDVSDIEMISLQSESYTSLRDMIPASPSSIMSPASNRMDSWREIPIKDPLVQHAAWAYLQPMTESQEADGRSLLARIKNVCCGLFGCFGDDILATVKRWLMEEEEDGVNGEDKDD